MKNDWDIEFIKPSKSDLIECIVMSIGGTLIAGVIVAFACYLWVG